MIDHAKTVTYGELETYCRAFAAYLQKQGLQPQHRVILYFDDCVEWPIAFLACVLAGLNPVCVNHNNSLERLAYLVDLVDAQAVITDRDLYLAGTIKIYQKNQIINTGADAKVDVHQYHDDEPCFWLLTSGTTGHPKAIVHRHKNLANYRDLTNSVWKLTDQSRVFSTAKLSFTYGLNVAISMGLPFGSTIHLMHGVPSPTRIFDLIDTHNITNLYTVPTVINSMLKHSKDRTLNVSLRDVVSAGESLPPTVSSRFRDTFGITIRNALGMSELTSMYLIQDFECYDHGSMGKPFPHIECKVLDDNGLPVSDDEVGELYVKSYCTASLYWKDWTYTRYTFLGEWLRTGDKVKRSPNGNFVYVSRANDQIKINGQFVSSVEVESCMLELEGVADCVVVFKTFDDALPEIHAFVVTDDNHVDRKTIMNFLSPRLPTHKIPKHYHFIDDIPRTLTSKKMRYELKNRL